MNKPIKAVKIQMSDQLNLESQLNSLVQKQFQPLNIENEPVTQPPQQNQMPMQTQQQKVNNKHPSLSTIFPTKKKILISTKQPSQKPSQTSFKIRNHSSIANNALIQDTTIIDEQYEYENSEFFALKDEEFSQEMAARAAECSLQELGTVKRIEVRVDLSLNSLQTLGFYVPNLIYLKLDGSLIKCIRDLGTSMQQLEGLWMANCQLQSLSGISIFCKLKRLGVSNNGLSEMNELCFHPNLEDLDFSYNQLREEKELDTLSTIYQLESLVLTGNPVCEIANYRQKIFGLVKKDFLMLDITDSMHEKCEQETEMGRMTNEQQDSFNHSSYEDVVASTATSNFFNKKKSTQLIDENNLSTNQQQAAHQQQYSNKMKRPQTAQSHQFARVRSSIDTYFMQKQEEVERNSKKSQLADIFNHLTMQNYARFLPQKVDVDFNDESQQNVQFTTTDNKLTENIENLEIFSEGLNKICSEGLNKDDKFEKQETQETLTLSKKDELTNINALQQFQQNSNINDKQNLQYGKIKLRSDRFTFQKPKVIPSHSQILSENSPTDDQQLELQQKSTMTLGSTPPVVLLAQLQTSHTNNTTHMMQKPKLHQKMSSEQEFDQQIMKEKIQIQQIMMKQREQIKQSLQMKNPQIAQQQNALRHQLDNMRRPKTQQQLTSLTNNVNQQSSTMLPSLNETKLSQNTAQQIRGKLFQNMGLSIANTNKPSQASSNQNSILPMNQLPTQINKKIGYPIPVSKIKK